MKILKVDKIREADAFTIKNEPILSEDLMERAGQRCVDFILPHLDINQKIVVFCGPGNNGGDGLVVARLMQKLNYSVAVFVIDLTSNYSADFSAKMELIKYNTAIEISLISTVNDMPHLADDDVVIDAIFGSGLNRPIKGFTAQIIQSINKSGARIYSIDIASGLFADSHVSSKEGAIIKANFTLSLQFPKLSMLMPENEIYVGDMYIIDIGIHPEYIDRVAPDAVLLEKDIIGGLLHNRHKFGHKGNYGHALLIAGSGDKPGAAIMASGACLRAGAGLLTTLLPHKAVTPLQSRFPEVMVSIEEESDYFSSVPDLQYYNAVAVGPGLGQMPQTAQALKLLIQEFPNPIIFDADALNILADNKTWLSFIPKGSIFTPHLKEFERLVGKSNNHFERIEKLKLFSQKYGIFTILKGAYSAIACPDGSLYFNNSGNPGMATAGSGDVLTGILLGLLAQGYSSHDTIVLGAFIHGIAGDLALKNQSVESLIASDLIDCLGMAYKYLTQ